MEISDKKHFEGVAYTCKIEFSIQLPIGTNKTFGVAGNNNQLDKVAREFVRRNIDNLPILLRQDMPYGHSYLVTEDPASYLSEATQTNDNKESK